MDLLHRKQSQPLNTFFAQNVEPFQKSSIVLSGGRDEPYHYSLGNQSTVPFVRLQGSGNTQKEFTWGETIEVLPGQNVQVQSASYMPGDIQIQSGKDIANRPKRISIPCKVTPFSQSSYDPNTVVTPVYPCDTRQARAAWLVSNIQLNAKAIPSLTFLGINKQHSWPPDEFSGFTQLTPTGKKYVWDYQFTPGTAYGAIPLGYAAQWNPPNAVMTLTDFVTWSLTVSSETNTSSIYSFFFYTLEY